MILGINSDYFPKQVNPMGSQFLTVVNMEISVLWNVVTVSKKSLLAYVTT
jgi:hypothetical protein